MKVIEADDKWGVPLFGMDNREAIWIGMHNHATYLWDIKGLTDDERDSLFRAAGDAITDWLGAR